jgi:hypothetical protein
MKIFSVFSSDIFLSSEYCVHGCRSLSVCDDEGYANGEDENVYGVATSVLLRLKIDYV